jgi:orsellinic acid C2-O-methyltransferase
MAGVLLERPGMLELARGYLAEQGVADRCELVQGDFFSSVPAGGDLYVLKSVLHDWDDERCIAILHSCRAAMDQTARLAIIELVLPERMTPSGPMLSAALLDLIMLAYAGGRERTEAEFRRLLDQARLRLVSTTPLAAGPHVLEAAAL